jgi:hypothetical protein
MPWPRLTCCLPFKSRQLIIGLASTVWAPPGWVVVGLVMMHIPSRGVTYRANFLLPASAPQTSNNYNRYVFLRTLLWLGQHLCGSTMSARTSLLVVLRQLTTTNCMHLTHTLHVLLPAYPATSTPLARPSICMPTHLCSSHAPPPARQHTPPPARPLGITGSRQRKKSSPTPLMTRFMPSWRPPLLAKHGTKY